MTEAFQFIPSLLASPEQRLSKIYGYRPHRVRLMNHLEGGVISSKSAVHRNVVNCFSFACSGYAQQQPFYGGGYGGGRRSYASKRSEDCTLLIFTMKDAK